MHYGTYLLYELHWWHMHINPMVFIEREKLVTSSVYTLRVGMPKGFAEDV